MFTGRQTGAARGAPSRRRLLLWAGVPPLVALVVVGVASLPVGVRAWPYIMAHGVAWGAMLVAWRRWRVAAVAGALPERAVPSLLAGAAVALALLVCVPPFTTHDVQRYLWDGAVLMRGFDPYRLPPEAPVLQPLRAWWPTPAEHVTRPTLYPPLALATFGLASLAGPQAGLWVWKAVAACAAWVTLWLGTKSLRKLGRVERVPLLALSPILLLEAGVGGHVDVLAAAAVAAALWGTVAARPAGTLAAGAATDACAGPGDEAAGAGPAEPCSVGAWRSFFVGAAVGVAALVKIWPLVLGWALFYWRPARGGGGHRLALSAGEPEPAVAAAARCDRDGQRHRGSQGVGCEAQRGGAGVHRPALVGGGILIGVGAYGSAWAAGLAPLGYLPVFVSEWTFGAPLGGVLAQLPGPARGVLGLVLVAAGLALSRHWAQQGRLGLAVWTALALPLLVAPVLFPWYLLALVVPLAWAPTGFGLAWIGAAPLTYEVIDTFDVRGVWEPAAWPLWGVALAWAAGLCWDGCRAYRRGARQAPVATATARARAGREP